MRFICKAIGFMLLLGLLFRVDQAFASDADFMDDPYCAIRLHVLANSDSAEDQRMKLAVRDAIIAAFQESFASVRGADEVYRLLQDHAEDMARVAEDTLASLGASYGARAEVGRLALPEKRYGDLLLPAGEYRGLRILLGAGEGQNWFCVLFPSLCLLEDQAQAPKLWSLDVLKRWITAW